MSRRFYNKNTKNRYNRKNVWKSFGITGKCKFPAKWSVHMTGMNFQIHSKFQENKKEP
ncbi:DUF6783 domain-containing protein [Blautia sp. HCP3S3_G3]|uniref:DUF6783 domain-containing protein n=1 Tax=Blautia sp. HCP3S3_G3 TaxID=3438913 RepID=UPI003F89D889